MPKNVHKGHTITKHTIARLFLAQDMVGHPPTKGANKEAITKTHNSHLFWFARLFLAQDMLGHPPTAGANEEAMTKTHTSQLFWFAPLFLAQDMLGHPPTKGANEKAKPYKCCLMDKPQSSIIEHLKPLSYKECPQRSHTSQCLMLCICSTHTFQDMVVHPTNKWKYTLYWLHNGWLYGFSAHSYFRISSATLLQKGLTK